MENKICLDTDIIIDILRGNEKTTALTKDLEKANIVATTYINLFELYMGIFLSEKKEENFNKIKELLPQIELINLSNASVFIGGKLYALLKTKGKLLESRDLLIASMAIANNFELLTKNRKHFEQIPGLKLNKIQ